MRLLRQILIPLLRQRIQVLPLFQLGLTAESLLILSMQWKLMSSRWLETTPYRFAPDAVPVPDVDAAAEPEAEPEEEAEAEPPMETEAEPDAEASAAHAVLEKSVAPQTWVVATRASARPTLRIGNSSGV